MGRAAHVDACSREAFQSASAGYVRLCSETAGPPRGASGIRSVAIVGAGLMGTAIAAAHVRRGWRVLLSDADPCAAENAPQRIARLLAPPSPRSVASYLRQVWQRVQITSDEAELGACDLVIESIVEDPAAKQGVLKRLESLGNARTILATNSSTIPLARLATALADPTRLVGLHFFHPVLRRPVVEVVRGTHTAEPVVRAALAHVESLGMMPLAVRDGPGFVVNRLLAAYVQEALELLRDGATIDAIERTATGFGMAMGPLRLMDEVGLDTVLRCGRVLWDCFPDRIAPSPILVGMCKAGRLGRKSGSGFFSYPPSGRTKPLVQADRLALELISQWIRRHDPIPAERILARLLLPMVLEATRLLEEPMGCDALGIDRGAVLGLGFPADRGGLLCWADGLGAERLVTMLSDLPELGPRAQPTPLLLDLARTGRRFYAQAA